MKLEPNLGNLDLIIRVAVGLVLITLMAVGAIGAWGLVGVVLIITGAARFCPLYRLLGIRTRRKVHHTAGPRAMR